jgi:hypothetical protein
MINGSPAIFTDVFLHSPALPLPAHRMLLPAIPENFPDGRMTLPAIRMTLPDGPMTFPASRENPPDSREKSE